MKRLFLPLLLLMSAVKAMAITEQTVFDFMVPQSLGFSPALTAQELNALSSTGDVVNITNKTITSDYATISFSNGAGLEGVALNHYTIVDDPSVSLYSLSIRSQAEMTITANGNRKLSEILIEGALGNMTIVTGEAGSFNTVTKKWTCGDNKNVTSVKFKNGPNGDTRIYKITVIYERPSTPLTFVSSTPSDKDTLKTSFSSLTMTFNTTLASVKSDGIVLTGAGLSGSRPLRASMSGKSVTLSADTTFSTNGLYEVTVPAGVFTNTEGETNTAKTFNFFVRIPISPVSVIPAEDTYASLPAKIELMFSEQVKVEETLPGVLRLNGGVKGPVTIAADTDDNKKVVLTLLNGEITEEGTWTIDIPAKAVHTLFYKIADEYDTWNEAFTLTYTIERQASPEMKEAKQLISLSGVGYPAEGSAGRQQLATAVAKGDDATTEELTAALSAFYMETNVTLPADSSWYRICGVNNAEETSRVYLSYNNEKVGLTGSSSQAGVFMALVRDDGKIVFQSSDGLKYLHVLTNNNSYNGTSPDNVTSGEKNVNQLTLAKLQPEGADSTLTLGKLTIFGSLGFTDDGVQDYSTAAIDYTSNTVVDSPTTEVYFNSEKSSAFVFETAAKPIDYTGAVTPTASFTPRYGILEKAGDPLTLVIHGVSSATIKDSKKPYFTHNHGERMNYDGEILTPTDIPYEFSVNTAELAADEYILVLPEGTFDFTANEENTLVRDVELTIDFTVKSGSTPNPQPAEDEPTATLSSTQISKAGNTLTVTIGNVKTATLKNASNAYYMLNNKRYNYSNQILSATDTPNQFAVNTAGLTDGTYTLVLPQGTFSYVSSKENVTVKDKEFRLTFTIKSNVPDDDEPTVDPNPDDKTSFVQSYGMIYWLEQEERMKGPSRDVDMNEFTLFNEVEELYKGLYCDPSQRVTINDYYSNTVIREGHFVQLPDSVATIGYIEVNGSQEPVTITYQRIKLVLDQPFEGGELDNRPGLYCYVIEPATYGDKNFGQWVKDPKSINRDQCRVNKLMLFQLQIDNEQAAIPNDIREVENPNGQSAVYDLSGRRQTGTLKPGVYVVNGKKRVVK